MVGSRLAPAGLAGDGIGVGVDPVVVVQLFVVAVGAIHLIGIVDADRDRAPLDRVIGRLVTVGALEIVAPHVHVKFLVGEVQAFVQVAMFDRVAAAAVEMTASAVFAGGQTDALRGGDQIDAFGWQAGRRFHILARLVVAHQAVDVLRCGGFDEVWARPAVTGMAACAAGPVALDADAKVVDGVGFADRNRLFTPIDLHWRGLPCPVIGRHDFRRCLLVAVQAGQGDVAAGLEWPLQQRAVICLWAVVRHRCPGIVGGLGIGLHQQNHRHNDDQRGGDQAYDPDVFEVFHTAFLEQDSR